MKHERIITLYPADDKHNSVYKIILKFVSFCGTDIWGTVNWREYRELYSNIEKLSELKDLETIETFHWLIKYEDRSLKTRVPQRYLFA